MSGPAVRVSRQERNAIRQVWALAGLAALPALVAAVVSVGADWTPASDYAPIEVRVRDVFSTHPPIVGAYSRLGGNHPGPALFYALALPYRLLGSHPWGLLVGAGLLNALWVALAVRIAGRRGAVGLAALVAALTLACTWGLGVEHLRDVWNPRLPVFAFLLAALATWAVVAGSRRSLPVALVAATFCAQAHVGYLGLSAVLVAWCALGVWFHRHEWRSWRAWVLLAGVAVGLLWAPPVAQQVFGEQGNLSRIVADANDTGSAKRGYSAIEAYLLPHLGPTPAWFRATPEDPSEMRGRVGLTFPPLGLLAFLAGAAVAVRRRDRDPMLLVAVTASLWAMGAFSISQLSGFVAPYLYRWVRVLGVLLWAAALWPLGRAVMATVRSRHRSGLLRRVPRTVSLVAARPFAIAGVVVGVLAVAVAAGEVGTPFAEYREKYRQTTVLADRTLAAVRERAPEGSDVEFRDPGLVSIASAVVGELERAGYHVQIVGSPGNVWGPHRRRTGRPVDLVVLVNAEPSLDPSAAGLQTVATVDLLTPEQRRTYERLTTSPARCQEIAFAIFLGRVPQATEAEQEECHQRAELSRLDRRARVFIGLR